MAEPDTALLQVDGLCKRYGGVTAVDNLTMSLQPGESLGVIGPNGAGKSTCIGLISGALRPSEGTVTIDGRDVTTMGAAARTRLGVGRTHQIPRPFGGMTTLENLMLAGRHSEGHESARSTRQRCQDILARTGLAADADVMGGKLPLLKRKRLELARALALQPRILLLDEIGAGLVEHEVDDLIELIQQVRTEVEGVILIEHVMDVITACCERTVVLDFGELIAQGPTREVLADPKVAAVYLGTASTTHAGDSKPASDSEHGPMPDPVPVEILRDQEPLLEVVGAEVSYGGVRALRGVDLNLWPGEVVALLGSNGAGKTTLANAISGVVPLQAGRIAYTGGDLAGQRPDQITAAGIAHCMEGRRIFSTLTVEENLILAADTLAKAEAAQRLNEVYELFPILAERRHQPGTAMSGGQQQMLAIGRALMTGPKLVIFDEISLGLAPVAVDTLYDSLQALRHTGVAMLLVEQNLERGLSLADRAYVLAHGNVALSGTPHDVRNHPTLASLYVGDSGVDE
jgi:branched-chain amino acid transport system ATP-binding protein